MPVTVHLEPEIYQKMEAENCVDCHQPTRYWLNPHTPLCQGCAEKRPGPVICSGCFHEIDMEICGCGDLIKQHGPESGHSPVPMGCECGRVPQDHHLAGAHRTTMTQEQRKELVRVVTLKFGDECVFTANDVKVMTDRQLCLTWLRMCEYISKEAYDREFAACVGKPLFPNDAR